MKILLPTDFSANALRAIKYAFVMYGTSARYTLLNTYEVPHSGTSMLVSISDILKDESQKLMIAELQKLNAEFPHLKVQIDSRSEMGTPEAVIKHLTKDGAYDLVIMGTKGATGLKEVLIGSVASNVMQNVSCPVFAVPEKAPLSVPHKILFAVDDAALNEGVFPSQLATLVKRFDAELLVLNIIPEGTQDNVGNNPENNRKPSSVFQEVQHVIHFVESNDLDEAIATFAQQQEADILAMITRKTDFFSRLFARSSTKKMMQHIDIPIIAFHA